METIVSSEIIIIITSIVIAMSTIFLTIITAVYVYLTWQLVQENKKSREELNAPKVIAVVEPYEARLCELAIKNIGLVPAYEIFIKIEPDFTCHSTKTAFSKYLFVKKGIRYLAPSEEFRPYLNSISEMKKNDNDKETIYRGIVTYTDISGKGYSNNFVFDPSIKDGTVSIGRKDKLVEIMKKIQKDLHDLIL